MILCKAIFIENVKKCFGEEFGGLKWSNGEGHLLYTAEKFVQRKEYYDAELDWTNEEKFLNSNVVSEFIISEFLVLSF